jgi:hypothetical protein
MPKVINLRGRKPRVFHEGEEYIGRRLTRGHWKLPESKWGEPVRDWARRDARGSHREIRGFASR